MIPFFQINALAIGPITIQIWGLFVSLGIIAGVALSVYLARQYFLSENIILDLSVWGVFGGFIGARLFHVIFYAPEYYLLHPSEILYFWQGGAASLGGFVGALTAFYIFAKLKNLSLSDFWPYLDILSVGLWLGWAIGRIGCFLIHDHPGTLSHSIFAVKFPQGARLDMGLLEAFLAFFIFTLSFFSLKKFTKIRYGILSRVSLMIYAVFRFMMDFWRADDLLSADLRYFHLTAAQWGMAVLFVGLTFSFAFDKMKRYKNTGEVA